jgi:hypothetical protein
MPIPALLAPLLQQGLGLIGNAVMAKGKEWVEEKAGVKLDQPLSAEDVNKLRQFEMEHQEELLRLRIEEKKVGIEELQAYMADTKDARNMQVQALKSDDPFVRRFIYFFAIFWSVMSAAYIGFITFGDIPEKNVRFADTILGFVLGTLIATIVQFFYGSSKGSQDKTAALAKELEDGK